MTSLLNHLTLLDLYLTIGAGALLVIVWLCIDDEPKPNNRRPHLTLSDFHTARAWENYETPADRSYGPKN